LVAKIRTLTCDSAAAGAGAFALKVVFFGLICTLLLQKPKKMAKYLWKPEKNH